jgi:hypothetical protein
MLVLNDPTPLDRSGAAPAGQPRESKSNFASYSAGVNVEMKVIRRLSQSVRFDVGSRKA